MSKLQIVRHGDLSIREALDIIEIKSIAWPYDADSQFQWMIRNLRENDLHFMSRDDVSNQVNEYINNNNFYAILLCKDKLIELYSRVGWTELKNESGMSSEIRVMQFGHNLNEELLWVSRAF